MENLKAISVISIIAMLLLNNCSNCAAISSLHDQDTLYVLYENLDYNSVVQSGVPSRDLNGYPGDWSRIFNILIGNHIHIWFYYFNKLPEGSDLVFDYKKVDKQFIDNHDIKDQNWFRSKPKSEILEVFFREDIVVYLIDQERINGDTAIMIRVYPDMRDVE